MFNLRTDDTGARWCYVDKRSHTCQDAFKSDRYRRYEVSYEVKKYTVSSVSKQHLV